MAVLIAVKRWWRSYSEYHAKECCRPNHDQDGSVVDGSYQEVGTGRANHISHKVAHPPASRSVCVASLTLAFPSASHSFSRADLLARSSAIPQPQSAADGCALYRLHTRR